MKTKEELIEYNKDYYNKKLKPFKEYCACCQKSIIKINYKGHLATKKHKKNFLAMCKAMNLSIEFD